MMRIMHNASIIMTPRVCPRPLVCQGSKARSAWMLRHSPKVHKRPGRRTCISTPARLQILHLTNLVETWNSWVDLDRQAAAAASGLPAGAAPAWAAAVRLSSC